MLPHIGAPSRTSSTVAPPHLAARSGAANSVIPRCSPGTPVPTEVARSVTPPRPGVARKPPRGDAAGAAFPRHRHSARRVARGAACSSARRLCRADAGQCRGRIELARDPRYVGGTVAVLAVLHTLDSTIEPAPARSLPGQRRRYIRGRHHLASGAAELPSAPSRLSTNWCAPGSGTSCAESAPISSSRKPCGVSAGSSTSPPGATANRPCSPTSPATSFASLSLRSHRGLTTKRSPSSTGNARPAFDEPAVSTAMTSCAASSSIVAAWLPQGPLLRAVASPAAPHRRPGAADAVTPGTTEARPAVGFRCSAARDHRRRVNAINRAVDLSAPSGAADLHPHAHAAPGHGTMIRSAHLRQNGSLLLPHAPARHGDRLSPAQLSAPLLLATPLPLAPRPPRQASAWPSPEPAHVPPGVASSACTPCAPSEISITQPQRPRSSNGRPAGRAAETLNSLLGPEADRQKATHCRNSTRGTQRPGLASTDQITRPPHQLSHRSAACRPCR